MTTTELDSGPSLFDLALLPGLRTELLERILLREGEKPVPVAAFNSSI